MQNSSPSDPDVPRLDVRSGKNVSPTSHWRSTQVARTLASSLVARAGDRGRRRAIGARRRRLRTHGLSRSRLKRFASKPIGPRQRLFAALARRSPQERGDFFSQALRWRPPCAPRRSCQPMRPFRWRARPPLWRSETPQGRAREPLGRSKTPLLACWGAASAFEHAAQACSGATWTREHAAEACGGALGHSGAT